jgi:hypothetical protein
LGNEYSRTIEPARAVATETLTLTRTLSALVNQAYALTPAEIDRQRTVDWPRSGQKRGIVSPAPLFPCRLSEKISRPIQDENRNLD